MNSTLKEVSPTQKEIKLQVDADSIKTAYARVSKRFADKASVPGFRKGYAPLDVVRMRFKEEIKSEVLQAVLPERVQAAIEEHSLQPLSEPQLHIENVEDLKVNGSQPIDLHIHVEVMPEIDAPDLKGIEVIRRRRPVSESDVEELITKRLEEQAALIPVEGRVSAIGDTVTADLVGTIDGEDEPISADGIQIKLGAEDIDPAFSDNLIGVKEDDEKEFTVNYAEDFSSPALAGKTVHYKASIKSVAATELPELNDEWAKSLDEGYESLADLRLRLRSDLESYSDSEADARVRNEAVAKLIEKNAIEIPETLIENQARNLLNNFARDLQQRGMDPRQVQDDFIQMLYTQMRGQAENDVRGALLLDKIAEAEKIEVTDAEVDDEVTKLAEHYRTTPEEIRTSLERQGGTGTIGNNLRTRKAIEALTAKIKVSEGEWEDPDKTAAAADAGEEKPKKAAKPKAKKDADAADEKPKKDTKKKAAK